MLQVEGSCEMQAGSSDHGSRASFISILDLLIIMSWCSLQHFKMWNHLQFFFTIWVRNSAFCFRFRKYSYLIDYGFRSVGLARRSHAAPSFGAKPVCKPSKTSAKPFFANFRDQPRSWPKRSKIYRLKDMHLRGLTTGCSFSKACSHCSVIEDVNIRNLVVRLQPRWDTWSLGVLKDIGVG